MHLQENLEKRGEIVKPLISDETITELSRIQNADYRHKKGSGVSKKLYHNAERVQILLINVAEREAIQEKLEDLKTLVSDFKKLAKFYPNG